MFVILCRRNDQWVTLLVLVVAVVGTAGVAGAVVFSYWWCR
jgi:Na+/H+-dicarboxylate symporter